jgi:hypothetical protein
MKPGTLFSLLALLLAALACNWTEVAPPPAPVIEPSPLPTFAISTLTPVPTETPLPTPTSTPDAPVAWPKSEGINCRYGPGQEWEVVSTILPETVTEIKGRTVNTAWWYVIDPTELEQSFCWVAYDVVDTAGNLNVVPIVQLPTASVTDVVVDSINVTFSACEGESRVVLDGTVEANGPLTVTYRWEVNGASQKSSEDKTLNFSRSGANDVSAEIILSGCGDYTAVLLVTEPDELQAQETFRVQSP